MSLRAGAGWAWTGALLLCIAARLPLHLTTFALPVTNDDAIPLLMARQMTRGEWATTPWNEPYNGTLDATLLAPLAWLGRPHDLFRLYQLVCGVLLVAGVAWLVRRFGVHPAWAVAVAGVAPPYVALMAALGPVPNFITPLLVLLVLALLWPREEAPSPRALFTAALLAGLAIWNTATALPAVVGVTLGLALTRRHPRIHASEGAQPVVAARAPTPPEVTARASTPPNVIATAHASPVVIARARSARSNLVGAAVAVAGLTLGLLPLLLARLLGTSAASPVTALRPRWLWMDGLAALARAGAGLLGLEIPLVIDGPERAALPLVARLALGLGLAVAVVVGVRAGRLALPLLGWIVVLAAAFALSRRSGGDEVRYLFSAAVPVLALVAIGLSRAWSHSRSAAAALCISLVVPWLVGHAILTNTWRDPRHAAEVWQVPDLTPTLKRLDALGIRSAYASLQFAGRLTVESEHGLIASQAWNERYPEVPLRFRDAVDRDPRAAWVLSPRISRGMPRAAGFREILQSMGGRWKEEEAGPLVIFHSFEPPFDESRPIPASEFTVSWTGGEVLPPAAFDGDPTTAWTSPVGVSPGAGLIVRLRAPRPVAALVLAVDPRQSPLDVPWICEADGVIVSRGPRRFGFQWVGGVPRAGEQAVLAVELPGESASEFRLLFQASGPMLVAREVFLYD